MKNSHRTWIEIDAQAFNHNINELRNLLAPQTALGVVVKSDAYGHGLELIGKLCQENSHVSWLFTAGLQEAIRLRESGVTKQILVLAYIDADPQALIDYAIACVVADLQTARELHEAAKLSQKRISVHLKIDTGMSRLGFVPTVLHDTVAEILQLESLSLDGAFTHLSDTNNSDYAFTRNQLTLFNNAVYKIEARVNKKLCTHALASGSLHIADQYRYSAVRVGTNIYGYWKSPLQQQRLTALNPDIALIPVLSWKTRIIDVKHINAGAAVSYHRAFIATKAMKIAILPIGYYDGYPRGLSHKGRVLVRNTYAPILGIISMNLMVVDVSAIGSVKISDEVVLCGDFLGISAHDLAMVAESMHLEFLARISPRIPRVVV